MSSSSSNVQKYFTVNEAAQMIPRLERAFARICQLKVLSQTAFSRLEQLGFAPEDENFRVHPPGADSEAVNELGNLKMLMVELREQIESLAKAGCLVKDITLGLVDMLAQRDGRDILLCWKLGEKLITHWHEIDAGYKDRQPLNKKSARKTKFGKEAAWITT